MNETDQRRNKISGLFPKAALIKISTYKTIINFIHKKTLSLSNLINLSLSNSNVQILWTIHSRKDTMLYLI